MINKLIRDGKVAVVYSPGYGAAWSTWGPREHAEFKVFDSRIALAVERGDRVEAAKIVEAQFGDEAGYLGGADDLEIMWLEVGQRFEIEEYDGSESVRILDPTDGFVA